MGGTEVGPEGLLVTGGSGLEPPSQENTEGPENKDIGKYAIGQRCSRLTRDGVRGQVLVNVDFDARVRAGVRAGEVNRSRISAASTGDLELSAFHLKEAGIHENKRPSEVKC